MVGGRRRKPRAHQGADVKIGPAARNSFSRMLGSWLGITRSHRIRGWQGVRPVSQIGVHRDQQLAIDLRALIRGFQILVMGWATMGWRAATRALSFAKLMQNGDDEGAFLLDRLPTQSEATLIRHYCGIARRKELSAERMAELQQRARGWSKNRPSSPEELPMPSNGGICVS
jgi:hypothetical protein